MDLIELEAEIDQAERELADAKKTFKQEYQKNK